ncbi:MAG: prepilin-type N-terminal cleavage/methylation domain-containing protein [Candidatus Krumholzibacteria bacterium]|nr:prepilin-type N-terminal cleavage/methylation domain-containing protein [Candidatus Krumholzibacteria bacterium]MDH5268935.1 prepilin-type N-terminal cleavage/methylation domain-containing protein [Candidatus Krumholzibacteria bacterium]
MRTSLNMTKRTGGDTGVTLVELMMTIVIFAIVLAVINNVFFSTNRLYGNTTLRAGQQMNVRAAVSLMITELRTAGCDPVVDGNPIVPFLMASGDSVHVQADYNADAVISTAEPSETVLYYYDPLQQAVMRDPGTGPQTLINNVTACAFTYFDDTNTPIAAPVVGADINRIRSIGINITTTTNGGGDVDTDTRVGLRNG